MRALLNKTRTLLSKTVPVLAISVLPTVEVLFTAATLNLSGHNLDARAFCFCFLIAEFAFTFTNKLPHFIRQEFFAMGANLDTEKRTIPVSYFLVFSLSFCVGSSAIGLLFFWLMNWFDFDPDLLDTSLSFLTVLFISKSLFLLNRIVFQLISLPQIIHIYENCVFYCFEFLLVYYFAAADEKGLDGVGQAFIVGKSLWLVGRCMVFACHFRMEFNYDFGLQDLLYRLWHDSFSMIEYYLDKGIAVQNINYTVFFLVYNGRSDQIIGLTIMILFYDVCEKFGTAVARTFKVKFKNLVGMGQLEGVFQRANVQLRIILFLSTITAVVGMVVSQGVGFVFEQEKTRKNELTILTCILGFTVYSFVCSPILFMLLRINGKDSLGYSVMWLLANKYRLFLAIPAFWFGAKWGLFGLLTANIVIDVFMTMLLFRSFTLYYLMKTIISKAPVREMERALMRVSDD